MQHALTEELINNNIDDPENLAPIPATNPKPMITKFNSSKCAKFGHHALMLSANSAANAGLGVILGNLVRILHQEDKPVDGIDFQQFVQSLALGQAVVSAAPYLLNAKFADFEKYNNPIKAQFMMNFLFPLAPCLNTSNDHMHHKHLLFAFIVLMPQYSVMFYPLSAVAGASMLQLLENDDQSAMVVKNGVNASLTLIAIESLIIALCLLTHEFTNFVSDSFSQKATPARPTI